MARILLVFLDGVGLGDPAPQTNPFAAATTPTLNQLAGGHRWLRSTGRQESSRALFIPTDPRLGVPGLPQSGTGQAAILTGYNVPALVGQHYGPKPDPVTRQLLAQDNFFKQVIRHGGRAALIEAYPPRWHAAVNSGKRLRASYQQAAYEAGLTIFDEAALYRGDALAVDWTGQAWRSQLGYSDSPVYTPIEAGAKMVEIARRYDFAFFSHWLTDVIGHRGTMADAVALLELFDAVMTGALQAWNDDEGLIIITSDHGNFEDLSHRHHTANDVPTVVVGRNKAIFANGYSDLTDLAPRMAHYLFGSTNRPCLITNDRPKTVNYTS